MLQRARGRSRRSWPRAQGGLDLGSSGQALPWRMVSVLVSFIAVRGSASRCEEVARPAAEPPATHCEQCYGELTSERSPAYGLPHQQATLLVATERGLVSALPLIRKQICTLSCGS
jgi:hypothetical protein